MQNISDRFHRKLHAALVEELTNRMEHLAQGSAALIQGDTATVAEKYSAQTAYIRALNDIIDKCRFIESELYGGSS